MLLKLAQVRKSFAEPGGGRLPILDVEAFTLSEGEQCVLVGQSGGGKTTLLHIIAGITKPDSGQVVLDGIDLAPLGEAARDRVRADKIGYIFQTFHLLAGFTALENVLLGMTFSGRPDRAKAAALLERVGLKDRLSHKPRQLSVGEQQRVAVARALANEPRLILADEPTASVDAAHQQQIIDLIRETCRERNIALLLVTHSPEVAEQFDRVERLETLNRVVAAAAKN